MTLGRFAEVLSRRKADFLGDDRIRQHGAALVPFGHAPPWLQADAPADEAIIETFLVEDRTLTALSDNDWLDHWRPRAQAMVDTLVDALNTAGVTTHGVGYLTCSITPSSLLEGSVHIDDDQYAPDDGVGVVAISGQHVGPRVARGSARLIGAVGPGPLPIDPAALAPGSLAGVLPGPVDQLTVLAAFGQIHAGPAATDLGVDPPAFRQLMVFRAPTEPV